MNSTVAQIQTPQTTRKKRVLRTPDQWRVLVTEFESSALTLRSFCDKHQIAASGLYKWRHHFSQTTRSPDFIDIGAQLNSLSFPAPPAESDSSHWQIELDLGHGMRLRVYRASQQ